MTQPPRDTRQGLLSGAGKTGFSHLELLDDQLLVLDVTSPPLTCLVRNQQNRTCCASPRNRWWRWLCFALLVSRASRLPGGGSGCCWLLRSCLPGRPGFSAADLETHTYSNKTWKRTVKHQSGHLITLKYFSLIKKFCETTFSGGCFLSPSQPLDVLRKLRRRWQISGRCARSV